MPRTVTRSHTPLKCKQIFFLNGFHSRVNCRHRKMQFLAAAQVVRARIKQQELFFCSLLWTTINSERTRRYKLQVWVWPKIYHQYGWLERNTTGWLLVGNAVSSREASPIKISSSHPIQKQGIVSWGPSRLAPLMRKLRNMQHPEWASENGWCEMMTLL